MRTPPTFVRQQLRAGRIQGVGPELKALMPVEATVEASNARSIALLEALGFAVAPVPRDGLLAFIREDPVVRD